MSNEKELVSSGQDSNEYYFTFKNTTIDALGQQVNSFFESEGYKLEEGTTKYGVYGKGSAALRVLFGAFVKRYKFNVGITESDDQVKLSIKKGMSGFSGGVIGKSDMGSELNRIIDKMKVKL